MAFVQVDLDGLWAVRRCYGGQGTPEQDDPVYSHALPAVLDLFDRCRIKATFFVIGADVEVAWKRRLLETVLERGHELANHSMTHDLGLSQLAAAQLEEEVIGCQKALREVFGIEARGFRAPGYGFSPTLVEVLSRLGFWYDSSLLPTPWGWVIRWMRRRISALCTPQSAIGNQYGFLQCWHTPLHPYYPDPPHLRSEIQPSASGLQPSALWEIPVSVSRRLRLPFHGGVGFHLGKQWVRWAIRSLRRSEGFLNYVMHGMDFVDGRQWDVAATRASRWFFGGSPGERLSFFAEICGSIRRQFEICRADQGVEHARKDAEKG